MSLLLLLMFVVNVSLGSASMSSAQGSGSVADRQLRVVWSVERIRGPLWTICGNVFNDAPRDARYVRLLLEGLDVSGNILSSHDHHILRDVTAGGRTVFCAPVSGGAATYRITITAVEWTYRNAP
jgi:hypothetical protein